MLSAFFVLPLREVVTSHYFFKVLRHTLTGPAFSNFVFAKFYNSTNIFPTLGSDTDEVKKYIYIGPHC